MNLPYRECVQKIFNYAGPILVSVETIRTLTDSKKLASDKIWYYVLETTRILLAHSSLVTAEDRITLMIVAHNMRNLYRLFGMDLSERRKWRSIVLDAMHYRAPNSKGRISISVDDPEKMLSELQTARYNDVLAEFQMEDESLKQYIGHCIYNLVGKRKESWQRSMQAYATLDM